MNLHPAGHERCGFVRVGCDVTHFISRPCMEGKNSRLMIDRFMIYMSG
jgi:hypothetical protein